VESHSLQADAAPAAQTITLTTTAPASAPYNGQFTLAATASSGLPVTFTSSGACSNVGPVYTITTGAGSCAAFLNQAGNANYAAAPQIALSVAAAPAAQTIALTTAAPASTPDDGQSTLEAP